MASRECDDLGHIDRIAGSGNQALLTDPGDGRDTLQQRVDRGQNHTRALAAARTGKLGEGRNTPGYDLRIRRGAIIGLAVPRRKGQRLDLGREEGKPAFDKAEAGLFARDVKQQCGCIDASLMAEPRRLRQHEGFRPISDIADGGRATGIQNA